MSEETTAVATINPIANQLEAAEQLGAWMAKSGLFGCNNVENGQILAMTCLTEKITPMEYLNTYDTVQGRPRMKTAAMLAKFIEKGGDYDIIKRDADVCEIEFTWREKKTKFSYDIEEAKLAKLVKSGGAWETHPKNMLFARCVSNYMRTYVPELFAGHYSAEEVREDIPIAPPVQVQPLFSEPKEPKAEEYKPTEFDVEVLPPEGTEYRHVRKTPIKPSQGEEAQPADSTEVVEPESETNDKAEQNSNPDYGWANCLVMAGIDLRMALDWLGANERVRPEVFTKVKPNARKATIAKAINTLPDSHKEKVENNLDAFKEAVLDLHKEMEQE